MTAPTKRGERAPVSSDWIFTYRVRIKNLVEHDHPDADKAARWCVREEGLFGCADVDDFELVSVERALSAGRGDGRKEGE